MASNQNRFPSWAIALALALVTSAVYWPARNFDFVDYDDTEYVTHNEHVKGGLTLSGIGWAMTRSHAGNWHPLTWITHMADVQLSGLSARGPHTVNLFLHALNSALVFLWLAGLTGARWRSAFVAALFAWHPLHVESVAWIAERKDVLSAFFWLLTLIAYGRYVARPGVGRYLSALCLFALGLLSKPMVVTLPCVLLLLDFWPLRRWTLPQKPAPEPALSKTGKAAKIATSTAPPIPFARLLWEKIPFFALSLIASGLTVWAQRTVGAVARTDQFTLGVRIANALDSYLRYLEKMFWPQKLAVIYPHPNGLPIGTVLVAVAVLAAITFAAIRFARRCPYLITGWLWYLGTLIPVIGLVQVGSQGMADRYTYIPLIGIFVMLAWGLPDLLALAAWPSRNQALQVAAMAALAACLVLTARQLPYWRDTVALFEHAQRVVPRNFIAHRVLGEFYVSQGRTDEGIAQFQMALEYHPRFAEVYDSWGVVLFRRGQNQEAARLFARALECDPVNVAAGINLANSLIMQGQTDRAIMQYEKVLQTKPDSAEAQNKLGNALALKGRLDDAMACYAKGLALKPDDIDGRIGLGFVLMKKGRSAEAVSEYRKAMQLYPHMMEAHYNLACALADQGKLAEADEQFTEAIRLSPNRADVRASFGGTLMKLQRSDDAILQYRKVVELSPASPEAYFNLGVALLASHHGDEAVAPLRRALSLRPDWTPALSALAWVLATHEDSRVRKGPEAVSLAIRAVQLTDGRDLGSLNTLAAAQAESGQFEQAGITEQKAIELANTTGQKSSILQLQERLKVYRSGAAFRDPGISPTK